MLSARTDANQKQIVKALRAANAQVFDLHREGRGCPDLLVAYANRDTLCWETLLMECKVYPSRFTEAEDTFLQWWKGRVAIVTSVEEALHAIGVDT